MLVRPSLTLGLKTKIFSSEDLGFGLKTTFVLKLFWPKFLAPYY